MKKILIIAYFFPPDNNGGTERVKQFHKRLRNDEFETYVLTKRSFLGKTEPHGGNDERVIRMFYPWFFLRAYNYLMRKYGIKMTLFKILARLILAQSLKKYKFDVILPSFPTLPTLQIGLMLKQLMGVGMVADFRDGLMYEPFDDISEGSCVYKEEAKGVEKEIVESASFVVSVTPQYTDYFRNTYPHVVAYTIMNGYDEEEVINGKSCIGDDGKFHIVYTGKLDLSRKGTFSYARTMMEELFESFTSIEFDFVGEFSKEEELFFSNFSNVAVYSMQSRSDAVETQRKADMLLLITEEISSGTHGKLFEYLFADKPILNIGGNNNGSRIIESTCTGKSFIANEVEECKKYIQSVIEGKYEYKPIDRGKYTRRVQCNEYLSYLREAFSN